MDNRPVWVIKFETALNRGEEFYREAADTLIEAMRLNNLNQKQVAGYIGKSAPWVCRLLAWRENNCPTGGPFAPDMAIRRKEASASIATSQSRTKISLEDLGQLSLPLLGGYSDYVPGQAEATLNAVSLSGACRVFSKVTARLHTQNWSLAFRAEPSKKRRARLSRLAVRLEETISAITVARNDLRATLKSYWDWAQCCLGSQVQLHQRINFIANCLLRGAGFRPQVPSRSKIAPARRSRRCRPRQP